MTTHLNEIESEREALLIERAEILEVLNLYSNPVALDGCNPPALDSKFKEYSLRLQKVDERLKCLNAQVLNSRS